MGLYSPWTEQVDLTCPLNEYPRKQLERTSYTCLNGWWEFQITSGEAPSHNEGWEKILVPFALGSKLSGTTKSLLPNQVLWYRRTFSYHICDSGQVLLNFEAVDQCCTVYLNGVEVGSHEGGYAPFSLDISDAVKEENSLLVKVQDFSDTGIYAYGKQKLNHGGMWYTPSSGIWQTVWIEDLPEHAIQDIKITVDYDHACVYLRMAGTFDQAVINVFEGKKLIHRGITIHHEYTIPMGAFRSWSPDDPFLYDLYIQTDEDAVKSYFGMRKFSKERDRKGYVRFYLNNQPLFLTGLLDQGYTVDGLLTYPTEEAMLYELHKVKDLGFNFLRKHVKQECRRWYHLCDKLGILVMQDMPNGGGPYDFKRVAFLPTLGFRKHKDDGLNQDDHENERRIAWVNELDEMLDTLYNCVCIFSWVPFNEGWGQFDSAEITKRINEYDTTRLVDSASGWFDQGCGDFNSIHSYFFSFRLPRKRDGRILFLSEFGGYAFMEAGHSEVQRLYGYKKFKDKLAWNDAIFACFQKNILPHIKNGLSGCVYTQLSDVEDECNGLFTADRRVLKIDARKMRKINDKCIRSMTK